ncbi:glycosyltransferase [Shewanella submarina]|uniref:Glycosyltransferase n=1 Tax=Shewanella submarina TaxID=2016376 RepID=A0ABV7GIA3_9GAMM|nr:glycosyltransferase [Shewanella submarina]MCL1038149.1 glycosyltransferase [Shewanella submarina]
MSEFTTILYVLLDIWHLLTNQLEAVVWVFPLVLAYELPLMLLVITGILKFYHASFIAPRQSSGYFPRVSVVITCYAEGDAVRSTIESFVEQVYDGHIEIFAVVDGAVQNAHSYQVACKAAQDLAVPGRSITVLPKWQRGGRVSTLNAGLHAATGEIIINADADTSFDCDTVARIVPFFEDPDVPAVGGSLRVRNVNDSLFTRMQSIEYMISIQGGKTGLGQWNLLNNVSGAFGAFRREVLIQIGGWDTHTAEDLDLTVRIKQYFARHPNWRIPFATLAIGHTDAPASIRDLVLQRLRWDGDLLFLYMRKHWPAFTPRLLGLKTFVFTLLYGVLQNVLMPAVILLYMVWLCASYPWEFTVPLFLTMYCLYLLVLCFMYSLVLLAVSERPIQDLKLLPWLPLYPVFALFMRSITLFALINEVVRRSHEESSMAPWWVLKRGRKF